MASLIAKRKKNKLYYYVVDSARVQGRPRIVHQTYLGSAERVAALLKERTAPLSLSPPAPPPRAGSARSPLVSRSAVRRLRLVAVALGAAPLRPLPSAL